VLEPDAAQLVRSMRAINSRASESGLMRWTIPGVARAPDHRRRPGVQRVTQGILGLDADTGKVLWSSIQAPECAAAHQLRVEATVHLVPSGWGCTPRSCFQVVPPKLEKVTSSFDADRPSTSEISEMKRRRAAGPGSSSRCNGRGRCHDGV